MPRKPQSYYDKRVSRRPSSSSDSDDLPPLIIERERKVNKHDDAEESYVKLQHFVQKYWRRLVAGNEDEDVSSTYSSSANADERGHSPTAGFHREYARDDNIIKSSHVFLVDREADVERMRSARPADGQESGDIIVISSDEEDVEVEAATVPARHSVTSLDTTRGPSRKRSKESNQVKHELLASTSPVMPGAPLATSSPVKPEPLLASTLSIVTGQPLASSSLVKPEPLLASTSPVLSGSVASLSPIKLEPLASSSPVVSGPLASSSPVVFGTLASSSPVVSGALVSSSPVVCGPLASSSPVVSGPLASSSPFVSGPLASSSPVESAEPGPTKRRRIRIRLFV